jgi:hypothetical protein
LPANEIEPRAVLGSESKFEPVRGLAGEPSSGLFGDIRGMVVEDQLDRRVGRIGGVDKLEEFDEFAAAMATVPAWAVIANSMRWRQGRFRRCSVGSLTAISGTIL